MDGKRKHGELNSEENSQRQKNDTDSDDDCGPKPVAGNDASINLTKDSKNRKKKKVLMYEKEFLEALPCASMYEKSYMHRDTVTHTVMAANGVDFLITASADGHIKFWKKIPQDIEFVKHYRAHLNSINDLQISIGGDRLCSTSSDQTIKFFDVVSFDMIHMLEVDFTPTFTAWVNDRGRRGRVAVGDADSSLIRIYYSDGTAKDAPLKILELHSFPIKCLAYNPVFSTAVSIDRCGHIEYWNSTEYGYPTGDEFFRYKVETDLYDLAKCNTIPCSISFSNNGENMAIIARDRIIRVFDFRRGKLKRAYDENIEVFETAHEDGQLKLDTIDFGRRRATERELEDLPDFERQNAVFDESGNFLMYPTLLGIKIVNLVTNKLARILGKVESGERFLNMSLYQGTPKVDTQFLLAKEKSKGAATRSLTSEELLAAKVPDPTLCCTAYSKKRFYLFTRREPNNEEGGEGRDVFNEKPTSDDIGVELEPSTALGREAVLRTTLGDIRFKLFTDECPRTVENFCGHARNHYYDGVVFHRVIKGFMIQTGDPLGDGTGGESIWGGDFADEFHRDLRHDRPFTVSMANSGRNTNGSQFFITTVPTPWLDNKHTVFGRVTSGMDVVESIENVKVDKLDRPFNEIKLLSVEVI